MNPLAWIDCGRTVKTKKMIEWAQKYYELSYRHYEEYDVKHCSDSFSFWSDLNREKIVKVSSAFFQ